MDEEAKIAQDRQKQINDISNYKKLEKIGEGTYGIVYRCKYLPTGQYVAMKKFRLGDEEEGIPPTSVREISLLKELKHPNIVDLITILVEKEKIYLVFEFMPMDLKQYLDSLKSSGKFMREKLVRSYMFQLICGLSFCHSRRILHRDLKPQNLLIDESGNIKLADFGLARAVSIPVRVYTHEIITMWYRAPEILLGQKNYSTPVDVWSLGAIYAEMTTNKALFPGDSEIDQMFKIFRILGTPSQDCWPDVENLPDFKVEFPKFPAMGIKKRLLEQNKNLELCAEGLDLMNSFLKYDPAKRLSMRKAFQHSYFDKPHLDRKMYQAMRCPAVPDFTKPSTLNVNTSLNEMDM
uniref:CDK1b protein n=1 Tax=Oikopleura dioica TaxID=34765 RepID=J9JF50_OIKDI|nr:CDK1b protein [Oikopleura dioica]